MQHVEYNDVYALTFSLTPSERDGESKLSIGIVHQDGPIIVDFNFKYLVDLIGATIDEAHQFPAKSE